MKPALSSLFAKRYLFSRKSHSIINIISWVSSFAIGVTATAMIILLSVFNGFEALIKSMYNGFDPDLLISATAGSKFESTSDFEQRLSSSGTIASFSHYVEGNALIEYKGGQQIVTVRGVDSMYSTVSAIEDMIIAGGYGLNEDASDRMVLGRGIVQSLYISELHNDPVNVYALRKGVVNPLIPITNYAVNQAEPYGVFSLDASTDSRFVFVSLDFARKLFDAYGMSSAVAVKINDGVDIWQAKTDIENTLGVDYKVLTREQQKASMYKIMMYEKWGIFLIISLVVALACFSIVGSVSMLIIDKKQDMRTIINLGGEVRLLRKVFIKQGMIISCAGALSGLILGVLISLAQQYFGLIRLPVDSMIVSSYPVVVKIGDLALVILFFSVVSYLITRFTVVKMIPKSMIRL